MYPFFLRGASTSFLALAVLLGGCSSPKPTNPPIPVTPPADELSNTDSCHKHSGTGGLNIYQCNTQLGSVFVTTVKDCSIPEKFTFQATTRQLLVGVMDLTVIRQTPVSLSSLKALQSIVHGTMDVDPFLMSIFTFHQRDCVTDLVVWRGSSHEKPSLQDTDSFSTVSVTLASKLVSTLVPQQDRSRATR